MNQGLKPETPNAFIRKALWIGLLLFSRHVDSQGQLTGQLQTWDQFPSRHVAPHRVDVWLPDSYSPEKKYAVLYCQDGQNLFDTTTNVWHKEWQMDETATRLMQENKTQPFIVVGIWSIAQVRHAEYFPAKAVRQLPQAFRDSLQINMRKIHRNADLDTLLADSYLQFVVTEVKPFIDSVYSTLPDKKHTFVMGSSSGGLSAMYAICEYPDVFGGAACLSTHFTGIFRQDHNPFPGVVLDYFKAHMPSRKHRVYFDTGDQGLDSLYLPHVNRLIHISRNEGRKERSVMIRTFPGDGHSETAWAGRLEIPLIYLLGKKP